MIDQKSIQPHLDSRVAGRAVRSAAGFMAAILLSLAASCSFVSSDKGSAAPAGASAPAPAEPPAAEIMARYEAAANTPDSTAKMSAKITENGGASRTVQFTLYRKPETGGALELLVNFTEPSEERDRDALITVSPSGDVEAVRYMPSSSSFLTSKSATDEDSLFGLTLQEMVGGQPEKYDYSVQGQDTLQGAPVYRLEGALKPGAESRFPRTVMLIRKDNGLAASIEAFDDHQELARKITLVKAEQIDGHLTRTAWSVDNQDHKKTIEFQALGTTYGPLPDKLFTRDHLKELVGRP